MKAAGALVRAFDSHASIFTVLCSPNEIRTETLPSLTPLRSDWVVSGASNLYQYLNRVYEDKRNAALLSTKTSVKLQLSGKDQMKLKWNQRNNGFSRMELNGWEVQVCQILLGGERRGGGIMRQRDRQMKGRGGSWKCRDIWPYNEGISGECCSEPEPGINAFFANNVHHLPPCLCPIPCAYMPISSLFHFSVHPLLLNQTGHADS